ncbi:MAG: hypothetical protein LBL67_04360 [Coriobacteriales bacterium]|jgi:hypothetical protein|nr:hypothetical protein [Coriobacteriales bacterium]
MKYLTGTFAFNLPDTLDTFQDWHYPALHWDKPNVFDTTESPLGKWGINYGIDNPCGLPVANHVRAAIDLLQEGYYSSFQGTREYFIGNERYTPLFFDKLTSLRQSPNWDKIDRAVGKEYGCTWLDFKGNHGLR